MARNYTLLIYNGTREDQDWSIYSDGVINQSVTIGQVRKSYTLTLSGDVVIQFGVDDTVYLTATYTYATDRWAHRSDTPNEFSFSSAQSSITVTSTFEKEDGAASDTSDD